MEYLDAEPLEGRGRVRRRSRADPTPPAAVTWACRPRSRSSATSTSTCRTGGRRRSRTSTPTAPSTTTARTSSQRCWPRPRSCERSTSPRRPRPIPWDWRVLRAHTLYELDRLDEIPVLPGPKFVFAHLLLPHDPYVFDSRRLLHGSRAGRGPGPAGELSAPAELRERPHARAWSTASSPARARTP